MLLIIWRVSTPLFTPLFPLLTLNDDPYLKYKIQSGTLFPVLFTGNAINVSGAFKGQTHSHSLNVCLKKSATEHVNV